MYRQISDRLWMDPVIRKMTPDARTLFIYLMTNPHTHLSGVYYLPKPFMAHEINTTSIDESLSELIGLGRVVYYEDREIVWVVNMFRYQGYGKTGNPGQKVISAIKSQMDTLSIPYLWSEFFRRYPIDTLSIPYPESDLNSGLAVAVAVTGTVAVTEAVDDEPAVSPPRPPVGPKVSLQAKREQPWTKGLSWTNGDKLTTTEEDSTISDLLDAYAKAWGKPKPKRPPLGADLCRVLEALWGHDRAGLTDETIEDAAAAVRGHAKNAKGSDIEKNWNKFICAFPQLEAENNRKRATRLDWSKYNGFIEDGRKRRPPPPAEDRPPLRPGEELKRPSPEEAADKMKMLREAISKGVALP